MNKLPPPPDHDDNPEWTEADFAAARPASELDPQLAAVLTRNKGGRPKGSNKEQVALRLDKDVLARYRAAGPGWQSRINEDLRKAAGLR